MKHSMKSFLTSWIIVKRSHAFLLNQGSSSLSCDFSAKPRHPLCQQQMQSTFLPRNFNFHHCSSVMINFNIIVSSSISNTESWIIKAIACVHAYCITLAFYIIIIHVIMQLAHACTYNNSYTWCFIYNIISVNSFNSIIIVITDYCRNSLMVGH